MENWETQKDASPSVTKFQEVGVIISDDKKFNDLAVSVTIDSKMVHLKEEGKKSRFDRMIPIRQVASCEVHTKSNKTLKWALWIIGAIVFISCLAQFSLVGAAIGALMFAAAFFIHDDFYVEIAASNGVPIKVAFSAKNKNDNINDRFVSIVRQLICEL